MKFATFLRAMLCFVAMAASASGVFAQEPPAALRDIVQFSVSAVTSARPDELRIVLRATREGADAGRVQRELQGLMDAALAQTRPQVQQGLLEAKTGNFGLMPRRGTDGRLTGWQGTAELTLSGSAMDRIADLAAKLVPSAGSSQGLVVAEVEPRLSDASRDRLEREARAQAIERFRNQAGEMARQFGYTRYVLREVSVSGAQGGGPRPRLLMAAMSAAAPGPIPVEQGWSEVSVSVSGSVQLLP